jgi:hypothetical protein
MYLIPMLLFSVMYVGCNFLIMGFLHVKMDSVPDIFV